MGLMFANEEWKRIRERGRDGQCRESNHTKVCQSWDPTIPNSKPKFIDEGRRMAAVFYGAIIDWATSKGKGLEFWWSGDSMRSTIILRAIRAIWGKEKCQMDMLYDYEKNFEDTYYIPVTLLTCMQEHFPVLMWAELFQTSPKFAYLHGPPKIVLAIELCMQGDPSPWKNAQLAIEDGTRPLPVANEPHQAPHQAKGSKKRSKPDSRSETATWLDVSPWQEWSTSERTWGGWISFPLPDWDQAGGTIVVRTRPPGRRRQAFQKNTVVVDGEPKATDSPDIVQQHRENERTRSLHHGISRKDEIQDPATQMRKAGG